MEWPKCHLDIWHYDIGTWSSHIDDCNRRLDGTACNCGENLQEGLAAARSHTNNTGDLSAPPWEYKELCWQMGWIGTILIISCKILTSSKIRDTMIVDFSHESFHAGKVINKDSYIKLHWYMK